MEHFVPKFLGFSHMTRDEFVSKHTRSFVQHPYANGMPVAVLVLIGTYIYIQKGGNYTFIRQTYGGHKHTPLVKPMMVFGTDGYVTFLN